MNQKIVHRPGVQTHKTEMKFERKVNQQQQRPVQAPQPQQQKPAAKQQAPKVYSLEELEAMSKNPQQQQKPVAERDSSYLDVTLPSNFYFYPFKRLSVRYVRGGEQAKFARAAREQRLRHVVDAISATLEPGISAYDLTMQDFQWLLYYQRINSYKKLPYIHKTFCESEEHLKQVIAGEQPEKSLEISQIISNTTLKETVFDPSTIVLPSFADKLQLDTVRMRDLVEISEMEEDPNFAELAWLADRASFIAPSTKYKSLRERIYIIQQLEAEQLEELAGYMNSVVNYGVQESITVRCNGCGAEKVSEVTIDALSFLPSR